MLGGAADSGWGMDWAVFPYEVGLFVLFTSSVISEIVQWIVQGLEYLCDPSPVEAVSDGLQS